jgi:hypothetical protein
MFLSVRRRAALAALLALAAAVALLPAATQAKTAYRTTFTVTFDLQVAYSHSQYWSGGVERNSAVSYRVTGPLGTATFVDGTLLNTVSTTFQRSTRVDAATAQIHGDGTSQSCKGGGATVAGAMAIARAKDQVFLAPISSLDVAMQCTDTNGTGGPGTFRVGAVANGPLPNVWTAVPYWAAPIDVEAKARDEEQFLVPYDVTVRSRYCPEWDQESTTGCTLTVKGDLTFIRTSRVEEKDGSDLLAPAEVKKKPALDRKRTKASATVRCPKKCDIGIEVFKFPKRKAPMAPFARKRATGVKGTRTVSAKLSASDRAAVAKDGAIAKLTVTIGGKKRTATWPLALPSIPGMPDVDLDDLV